MNSNRISIDCKSNESPTVSTPCWDLSWISNFRTKNMSITSPLNSGRCDPWAWCILMTVVLCSRTDLFIVISESARYLWCTLHTERVFDCFIKLHDDEYRCNNQFDLNNDNNYAARAPCQVCIYLFPSHTDDVATVPSFNLNAPCMHILHINLFVHRMLQRLPFSFFFCCYFFLFSVSERKSIKRR